MYDSREKALLDYESGLMDAREKGREEGQAIGESIGLKKGQAMGRIQLLQDLLTIPVTSDKSLRSLSLEELASMVEELQAKLRLRNS
jgi:flagellar biosynthesis/type III secretory pathway protein FliH